MAMSSSLLLRLSVVVLVSMVLLVLFTCTITNRGLLPISIANPANEHHDLPWYKHAHRAMVSPLLSANATTSERQKLQEYWIDAARALADRTFGDRFKDKVPGTHVDVATLRATIDGWTRVAKKGEHDGGGGGRWIYNNSDNIATIRHIQDEYYSTCDHHFYATHSNSDIRDAVRYRWQPEQEHPLIAEDLDRDKWCELLDGRNIMVVGDLVQYQIHELLLDILRDGPSVCYGEMGCKPHTICQEPHPPATLRYYRNDILANNKEMVDSHDHGHPSASVVLAPFMHKFMLREYDVYILNAATVADDDDDSFMQQLVDTLATLREHKPNALVIYTSSYHGHPYCDDAIIPLDRPLTDIERRRLPYGWSEIARRNAIARVIIEAAGGLFVDLGAIMELRPDGHIGGQDCLRYCMPGPLDAWGTLLYNVMLATVSLVE